MQVTDHADKQCKSDTPFDLACDSDVLLERYWPNSDQQAKLVTAIVRQKLPAACYDLFINRRKIFPVRHITLLFKPFITITAS